MEYGIIPNAPSFFFLFHSKEVSTLRDIRERSAMCQLQQFLQQEPHNKGHALDQLAYLLTISMSHIMLANAQQGALAYKQLEDEQRWRLSALPGKDVPHHAS